MKYLIIAFLILIIGLILIDLTIMTALGIGLSIVGGSGLLITSIGKIIEFMVK